MPGTAGLSLRDIHSVLLPGRGRAKGGRALTLQGTARVKLGTMMLADRDLPRLSRVVCSGYKSPADLDGDCWVEEDSQEAFVGIPEADLMRTELLSLGVTADQIYVERHSIDSCTNLLRCEAEGLLGKQGKPVGIVAQADHLARILADIAPRVMRRPYLGIVAPSAGRGPRETVSARVASRLILAGLPGDPRRACEIGSVRAARLWSVAMRLGFDAGYHD